MRSEKAVWKALRPLLKGLDPVRIENVVGVGTPDVNYTHGWIELKNLSSWPENYDAVVKVDHFTPQQRVWLTRRALAGGRVFLLLVVGEEWLLFSAASAAKYVGRFDRQTLRDNCIARWHGTPSAEELQRWL